MIPIVIIEDISDIREGLSEFFRQDPDIVLCGAYPCVEELFSHTERLHPVPEIFLLDIQLPGISGINAIPLLADRYPNAEFLMLSVFSDTDRVYQALCSGASGYLLKTEPLSQIKQAIMELHSGGAPMSPTIARKVIRHFRLEKYPDPDTTSLTQKERDVIHYLVDGMSYKQIAAQMGNTVETIRHHIKNIYRKLHVNSKAEVIGRSMRGLL
jgi:DNA-binding NarL/FixJ family response regulator